MGNELSSLLLPCVPTYSSLGLSARILTTLKAPGDIPTPVRMLLQPSRQGQGTLLSSAVSADAPTSSPPLSLPTPYGNVGPSQSKPPMPPRSAPTPHSNSAKTPPVCFWSLSLLQ